MDITIEKELSSEKYPMSKEKLLLEKAALGETEASVHAFSYIFEWLQIEYYGSIKNIKAKLIELMILVSRLAYDYKVDSQNLESIDFISELQSLDSPSELKLWCSHRIEFVTKIIREERLKKCPKKLISAHTISVNYLRMKWVKTLLII